MPQFIALLLACVQLFCPPDAASARAAIGMQTGITLRMHVIGRNDSQAMQRTKLAVRDGIQAAYNNASSAGRLPMLLQAHELLPELTLAAEQSARSAGYSGDVLLSLAIAPFSERRADGLTIPAGLYPALIVRIGEAEGRNWWGLIDPQLALSCAAIQEPTDRPDIVWDWSLGAFLEALQAIWHAVAPC